MSSESIPLSERVSASFSKLSSAAKDLNQVSDELGKSIASIDQVLQRLNLGVPTWVKIHGGDVPYSGSLEYWSRDLGYAKINNRWGVALRTREGDHNYPEEEESESWLFNDAPRWLRVEGIEKVPELLEELVKNTQKTTEKIKSKIDRARELASALEQAAAPPKTAAGQKSLTATGNLSEMAEAGKLIGSIISPASTSLPKGQK